MRLTRKETGIEWKRKKKYLLGSRHTHIIKPVCHLSKIYGCTKNKYQGSSTSDVTDAIKALGVGVKG